MRINSIRKVKCKTQEVPSFEVDGIKFIGSISKMKVKGGLRDAFICPPGYVWITADYAQEEIRLLGNFSGEVNYIEPILQGKDIHNYIAKKMFGYEDPSHRTKVKTLNFAVGYGATEHTISKKLGISVLDAKALLDNYNSTLSQFTRWKQEQCKIARRKGMVFTYFGRPRLLYKYYNSPDKQLQAFADRTAVNTQSQGCTPLQGFLELDHSVVQMKDHLGQRLSSNGTIVMPTHRGEQEPILCVFNTGDFMVCDINHKFITGSVTDPKELSLRSGLRKKVLLSKLHKKQFRFTKTIFQPIDNLVSLFKLSLSKSEVLDSDKNLSSALFRLALSRSWFTLNYLQIIRARSMCSIFGYNLLYSEKKDAFRVSFYRRKSCRLTYVKSLLPEGETVPVGSCTVVGGLDMYPNQGFWNKNTGGDIIRLVLCRLVNKFKTDPEWAENVKFVCTVHDEINLYVKPSYLHKVCKEVYKIMYFCPKGFKVPIVPSLGIGTSWGTCIDIDGVSEDNKIQLKDFDETVDDSFKNVGNEG